jgi:hypothetical protein
MSSKADEARLAKGAKEIEKAKKQAEQVKAATVGPLAIPKCPRPIQEILRDRVKVFDGHIGLKIADDTTIEESLVILDWATGMSNHVGFMIGDVINFGRSKWGEKYNQALNQTGRAYSTLAHYASVAARITPDKRHGALSFDHHRTILTLGDAAKIATVLKEVGEQAEKGHAPTTKELRIKVQQLTPRKVKKLKTVTSGKGKRKAKPEPPPYEPDAAEQSKLDFVENTAKELAQAIKDGEVFKIGGKLDNTEKRRWLNFLQPVVDFYKALERVTGY